MELTDVALKVTKTERILYTGKSYYPVHHRLAESY